jgi:membrane-associated phospholipid phosphatase
MKALGLISGLNMPDKKERIGPLIITGLFYMWLYVNVRNNDNIPAALSFFILGMTIAVFLALIINSFNKISLHTIGAGGFLMGMIFITFRWTYGYLDISLPFMGIEWRWSDRLVLALVFILVGAVGTSRLYLKAHLQNEIYGGYLVGILSQMIAYRIFF